jgi:hypothetical protein
MLNGIEKQRQGVRRVIQKQKTDKMLADMGKPIKWVGYKSKDFSTIYSHRSS